MTAGAVTLATAQQSRALGDGIVDLHFHLLSSLFADESMTMRLWSHSIDSKEHLFRMLIMRTLNKLGRNPLRRIH